MCRESENVIVSPSGSLLRLKSPILEFSLLDCSLHFQDRAVPLENLRRTNLKRDPAEMTADTAGEAGSGGPPPLGDQMILVVSSERGATAFSLPSQKAMFTYKSPECAAHHLQAQTVAWPDKDKKHNSVLLFFTSDGKVKGNPNTRDYRTF